MIFFSRSVFSKQFIPKLNLVPNFSQFTEVKTDKLLQKYSEKDKEKILNYLNTYSNSSSKIKLTQRQQIVIETFLKQNKEFKNLDEVFGLGSRLMQKICNGVLSDLSPKVKNSHEVAKLNFLVPLMPESQRKELESVVGIQVGNYSLSWSRLDFHQKIITNWEQCDYISAVDSKNLIKLYEFVINLRNSFPASSVYVMENTNWSIMSSQTNLMHHTRCAQITSMLIPLLNERFNDQMSSDAQILLGDYNHVYFLKTFLPTRYFRTLIGTERVSPQNMVEAMFEGNFPDYCTPISINEKCKNNYLRQDKPVREVLCQSLLLSMAFMETVLYNKVDRIKSSNNREKI